MRPEANCRAILIKDGSLSTSAGPSKPHPRTHFPLQSLEHQQASHTVSSPTALQATKSSRRNRRRKWDMWRKCTQGVTNLSLISGSIQVLSTTSADKLNGLKRVPSSFSRAAFVGVADPRQNLNHSESTRHVRLDAPRSAGAATFLGLCLVSPGVSTCLPTCPCLIRGSLPSFPTRASGFLLTHKSFAAINSSGLRIIYCFKYK